MNLDLLVYDWVTGALVAGGQSTTTGNSYEHVDIPIRAPANGCVPFGFGYQYRIEVRLTNWASVPSDRFTYYGLAWQVIE
jgi:hypothetical protein